MIRALAETALSAADQESLTGVPGIAASTAEYIAARAFRQPDAFPSNDPVLLHAGAPGKSPKASPLIELAERWRPWRSYAAIYLWMASVERH